MKKGLIVVNAYCNIPSMLNQSVRLKEEFEILGVNVDVVKNGYNLFLDNDGNISGNIDSYDFCIYLDKDKYFAELLQRKGIKTFNKISSITTCDDKMLTQIALCNINVKMPKTFYAPLNYSNCEVSVDELKKVSDELKFPIVVKLSYSSLGKGVFKVDNLEDFYKIVNENKNSAKLYQEYVSSSYGKDVRIICIGKKYLCAMLRKSTTDFRSNAELGGVGYEYNPPKEFIEVAEKIADVLDLDYMGVDLMFGKDNEPILCEVNSNAFFGVMEKVSKVNVAKAYANYVISQVYCKENLL